MIGILLALLFIYIFYKDPSLLNKLLGTAGGTSSTTTPSTKSTPSTKTTTPKTTPSTDGGTKTPTTPSPAPGTSGGCSGANWDCITHRDRLEVVNCNATITGTVTNSSTGPHQAPDGDLVFALKPDPQYANMINDKNKTISKYNGAIWIEGVCQGANKATEARHQGDCKCSPTKFKVPKVGQRLRVTGAHVKDVGEEGHMEIHPATSIEPVSGASVASIADQSFNDNYHSLMMAYETRVAEANLSATKIRLGNLSK